MRYFSASPLDAPPPGDNMAANRSGLRLATIWSIALAWVLTLPAAMLLAGGLFLLFRQLV
jgi:PiT family inorganic phosphate transporter